MLKPDDLASLSGDKLILFLLFSLLVSVAAVLTALDAFERGKKKEVCVLWFLGIQFFPPVIFAYFFLRMRAARENAGFRITQQPPSIETCPYCGAPKLENARLCSSCGRLL